VVPYPLLTLPGPVTETDRQTHTDGDDRTLSTATPSVKPMRFSSADARVHRVLRL